jgi:uncharacterized membrane protein
MAPAGLHLALGADKPAFDLLLIGHVASAIFGFGALATSGVQAVRLRRNGPGSTVVRYFAPGVNWVGRVVYGVPLFGFALLADSHGHLRIGDAWVVAGLVLWALAIGAAEGLLWPAERRIQAALAAGPPDGASTPIGPSTRRDCAIVGLLGAVLAVIFITATVLMVAKPG